MKTEEDILQSEINSWKVTALILLVLGLLIGCVSSELIDKWGKPDDTFVGKIHYIKIGSTVINYTQDSLEMETQSDTAGGK